MLRALVALLAGAAMSASSLAAGYQPVYSSGNYVGVVGVAGHTPVQHAISMAQGAGPYQAIYDAAFAIYTPLRAEFEARAAAELQRIEYYRWHRTSVSGPLRLSYNGSSPSRVSATAPTFALHARFAKEIWGGLISGECDVRYSTGAVSLVADDLVSDTGLLLNPRIQLQSSRSIDCDSTLSWVPLVGNLLERWVESKLDGLLADRESALIAKLQEKLPQGVFFGFPVIPPGKYLFNGVDYGAYITNNLPYLVKNSGIDVFIEDPYLIAPRAYGIVSSVRASIGFHGPSAGLSFTLREDKRYVRKWVCDPGVPCQQP